MNANNFSIKRQKDLTFLCLIFSLGQYQETSYVGCISRFIQHYGSSLELCFNLFTHITRKKLCTIFHTTVILFFTQIRYPVTNKSTYVSIRYAEFKSHFSSTNQLLKPEVMKIMPGSLSVVFNTF